MFKRITILIFSLITVLSLLFIGITYLATMHFYQAQTQLLNKDVAAHIAEFTSPFGTKRFDKKKADSVFHNAMVLSPSAEVYFLDTTGKIIAFHAPKADIKVWDVPLKNITKLIKSHGEKYIRNVDPKDPDNPKIFSAAAVSGENGNLGYIYVIFGNKQYRNVTQMLLSSHITNLALQAFLIIIIITALISLWYIKSLKKNYSNVVRVLEKFQQGDFNSRFKIDDKSNGLKPVKLAFNKMAEMIVSYINTLTKSEQERKDFIITMSHDLRTPLAIARGYAETLIIEKETSELQKDEQETYARIILNKILQVETMVNQLFELSKMKSAEIKLKKEPFVFSEIVQEIVNTFKLKALEKKITLQCKQSLYHVWINADISMMERVITNLVDNAVKSTSPNGTIYIYMEVNNDQLIFNIENTGQPIPEDILFWINNLRQENLHSNTPSSAGVGLLVVKKMLQLHNYSFEAKVLLELHKNIFSIYMPVYPSKK